MSYCMCERNAFSISAWHTISTIIMQTPSSRIFERYKRELKQESNGSCGPSKPSSYNLYQGEHS